MCLYVLTHLVKSITACASGPLNLSSVSSCALSIARRTETRLYSQEDESHAFIDSGSNLHPKECVEENSRKAGLEREMEASEKVRETHRRAMPPNLRRGFEMQRQAGYPNLRRARETQRQAGYPNLRRGRETQRLAGYPNGGRGREAQRQAGFPNLKKGRETNQSDCYLGLARGRATQRKAGYPGLKKGRRTLEAANFLQLDVARAKRMTDLDAQRALQSLPPKQRREIPCPRCNKKFASGYSLRRHVAVRHDGLRFRCYFAGCEATYRSCWSLRNHRRKIHNNFALISTFPNYDPSKGPIEGFEVIRSLL